MKQAGKPVTGNEFIGREKELTLLLEYMKMGQSVVLVAPRRFGKTSLVLEALNRLHRQKYYTAYIDVFTNPTLELLSSAIVTEVLKNHKLHDQFAKAKNSITALVQNVKLKAVMNEFQFIMGFADQSNATYIFSGSMESVMKNMFVTSKSPFYRLARIIKLGYMEKEPWIKYLGKGFKQLKIVFPENR